MALPDIEHEEDVVVDCQVKRELVDINDLLDILTEKLKPCLFTEKSDADSHEKERPIPSSPIVEGLVKIRCRLDDLNDDIRL